MFIAGIVFLIVACILIGVGLVIGLLVFGAASVAIGFGMISASVACGFIQKKPSAGFRIFFYQLFIVIFLTAGIASTWLVSFMFDLYLPMTSVILIGSLSGISVGLLFGLLHSYLITLISRQLQRFFTQDAN